MEVQETKPGLIAERMKELEARSLSSGGHSSVIDGLCVMEATAYVAGLPHSDAPECTCPVITAFMVVWNDALPSDAERDRLLKPLIPLIVGTRSTPEAEERRATMAADWLIRVHTPAWLRAAQLEQQAAALETLPEITDFAQCPSLMPTLNAVKTNAAAAWEAARAAAGAAAWAAAGAAAWDAAWAAAWAAARAAARAAAWDALDATTKKLQDSAVDLVKRMCEVQS